MQSIALKAAVTDTGDKCLEITLIIQLSTLNSGHAAFINLSFVFLRKNSFCLE